MNLLKHRLLWPLLLLFVPLLLTGQSLVWQDISGVPGCFALRRGAAGVVLAASEGGQAYNGAVYRSYDNGVTWGTTSVNYGFLTQLETRGARVLTSRFVLNSSPTYQVFLSADNGSTWNRILGDGFESISSFIISDSGTIYGIINPFLSGGGGLRNIPQIDGGKSVCRFYREENSVRHERWIAPAIFLLEQGVMAYSSRPISGHPGIISFHRGL